MALILDSLPKLKTQTDPRDRRRSQPPSPAEKMIGAVVMIVFGIAWTAIALVMTRDAPVGLTLKAFPFFGAAVVCFGIYRLTMVLRERAAARRGEVLPLRGESRARLVNRLGATVLTFFVLLVCTVVARGLPLFVGKICLLVGVGGLVFTGRSIFRQVKVLMFTDR